MNMPNLIFVFATLALIAMFINMFHPRTRDHRLNGSAHYVLMILAFGLFYVGNAQATDEVSLTRYLDRAAELHVESVIVLDGEATMHEGNAIFEDAAPNVYGHIHGAARMQLDKQAGIIAEVYRSSCKKPERVEDTTFEACRDGGATIFRPADKAELA